MSVSRYAYLMSNWKLHRKCTNKSNWKFTPSGVANLEFLDFGVVDSWRGLLTHYKVSWLVTGEMFVRFWLQVGRWNHDPSKINKFHENCCGQPGIPWFLSSELLEGSINTLQGIWTSHARNLCEVLTSSWMMKPPPVQKKEFRGNCCGQPGISIYYGLSSVGRTCQLVALHLK